MIITKHLTHLLLITQTCHAFIHQQTKAPFTTTSSRNLQLDPNAVNYKYKIAESATTVPPISTNEETASSIKTLLSPISDQVQSSISDIDGSVGRLSTAIMEVLKSLNIEFINDYLNQLDNNELLAIPIYSLLFFTVFTAIFNLGNDDTPDKPYPNNVYDAKSSAKYFDNKPLLVLQRAIEVALLSTSFGINLLLDYITNNMESNSDKRGLELATLLTKLGPSFIKIGQSLSIRTDLLPPSHVRGLKTLQDQVPPFDTKEAKQTINNELRAQQNIFSDMSSEPIATASLGQVHKATLLNGTNVAIKVQRPNIMTSIALDMCV